MGERVLSFAAADSAAEHAGMDVSSLDAVGEFFFHAGDYHRASALYDRAIAAAPKEPVLWAKRGDIHRVLGRFEAATADYEAVLALSPQSPKALKGLSELRRQSAEHNSIAAMQTALIAAAPDSPDAAILHFGLAKTFEDLGDHARSWQHFAAGNGIERARLNYSVAQDRTFFDALMSAFPAPEPAYPDTTGESPIFIVGLPRTGSTLVERIISGHSQIFPAGESPALLEAIDDAMRHHAAIANSRNYGELFAGLDPGRVAAQYLRSFNGIRGNRPRIADKMLANFCHCATIIRAFPQARIVHVTRHPLAVCLAIYQTRFNGPYPFAYDLREIGEFYIGYRRLMAHWRAVLPNRIHDVAYEDIVRSLAPTAKTLFDYLGLPFEAGCLEFQGNAAPVNTQSSVQVRQPLYQSSLDRWKNHAAQLAPLRAQLQAEGITIE
jgi:tetratricopeptide (TPR) repeat protein